MSLYYNNNNNDNNRDNFNDNSRGNNCDSGSARALRQIVDLLDDLNRNDLNLLDNLIDRLLCMKSC